MEQQAEGDTCPLADKLRSSVEGLADLFHIGVRLGIVFGVILHLPDAVQLAQNAGLHFLRRLVCEGDGEDVAISLRILDQELDVLYG